MVELLTVIHLWATSGLDFLELRECAKARGFRLTGAAAGSSEKCEGGCEECGKDASHGKLGGRL
jgi:hypothetical protein